MGSVIKNLKQTRVKSLRDAFPLLSYECNENPGKWWFLEDRQFRLYVLETDNQSFTVSLMTLFYATVTTGQTTYTYCYRCILQTKEVRGYHRQSCCIISRAKQHTVLQLCTLHCTWLKTRAICTHPHTSTRRNHSNSNKVLYLLRNNEVHIAAHFLLVFILKNNILAFSSSSYCKLTT